ncbi:MAG: HVO_0476 family zinc finger protein, partial [Methanobacteriota archaeon]
MDVPKAVTAPCPECGEETIQTVLHGTAGKRAGASISATLSCTRCKTVHQAVIRSDREREVPVVVSKGRDSRRTRLTLGEAELVSGGDELIV